MNFPDFISRRLGSRSPNYSLLAVLFIVASIPRILGAFFLPSEEGDPYSYFRAIEMMRTSVVGGTFTLSELFGFWLPLYQFICALISAVVGHPLYVAKLVSAISGTGVCLMVFAVSMRLTANRVASLAAFALIALNPIHIMYSSFSMSDVPHGFLVISSLYLAIKDRWRLAATLAAAGGLMRPESWLLIALLPALQWLLRRRISVLAFFISVSGLAVWIYISWAATGDPLEYFKVRSDYIRELLARDPGLADLSWPHVAANLKTLAYSAGPAILIASTVAVWLLAKHAVGQVNPPANPWAAESSPHVAATAAFFFTFLGFLVSAYFTGNQPAIFARYCLVLYALGLPVLAWTLLAARQWRRALYASLGVALVASCIWQFAVQFRDGVGYVNQVSQKRIVADYLRGNLQVSSNFKVFCDDDTVRVLSAIPEDRFVSSSSSPSESSSLLNYLKENRVEYLVYEKREGSAAAALFRDLGEARIKDLFQQVASTNTDMSLYRMVF